MSIEPVVTTNARICAARAAAFATLAKGPFKTPPGISKARRTRVGVAGLVFVLGLLAAYPDGVVKANDVRPRNVVVLSGGRGRASLNQMEAALRSRVSWPVNFSVVDLDNPRFEDEAFRANLAQGLHFAYGEKPDLVLACMDPSLRFAVQYRDSLFAGLPIVYMSTSSILADRDASPGITGVAVVPGIRETIDLALRLHPQMKAFAVISGGSETEGDYFEATHQELLRHPDKKEIDIVGPPSGQMLERVAALPPDTVVLFQLFPHDSEQLAVGSYDVLTEASQRLPTYSIFPSLSLDHGGIGGAYTDSTQDAVLAGQMAARVLNGEPPDKVPVAHLSNFQIRLDWRQLQRWHIAESALPRGALVLYQPPNVWQQYKWYIVAAISLMVLQTSLILGLIWHRARRRRSDRELGIAYDRLRMTVEAARLVGWDADYKTGKNRWFGDLESMFGLPAGQHTVGFGDFEQNVHPDDRDRVLAAIQRSRREREPYVAQFRVVRPDGSLRWISARGKFYYSPEGKAERMLGMAADMTERTQAEEALNNLSGQLILAQEEERRRIAREIHDDYQQRLAVLAIELDSLSQDIGGEDKITLFRLRDLADQVNALGRDLHALSHSLHSSTLDKMGLVTALKGLCSEFRKYHDLDVTFVARNVPAEMPNETALCLFRVAQEALQNARKHSQSRRAEVRVEGREETICLSISDEGVGFDPSQMGRNGGIGIRSMEERVRLVKGRIEVQSKPGRGATIVAWVPAMEEAVQANNPDEPAIAGDL